MPLISYTCECKTSTKKFYRQATEVPAFILCKCGKEAKKALSAPTSSSKITVDNGFQSRAVEINPEIIKDNKERSTKDFREE